MYSLIKKMITTFLPIPCQSAGVKKYVMSLARDSVGSFLARRDPFTPPTRLMFDGPMDAATFKANGEEYLNHFRTLGELQPHERVLDVGCGIGRKAIPLTRYLNGNGTYDGFDIVKVGIDWCKEVISTKHHNFHFQLIDVFNKAYNPKGRYSASEYRFPFDDGSFDLVVVTSVFTHMLSEDMENYFSEIARVMKVNGRCLISFLLSNKESFELITAKRSTLDFAHATEKYRAAHDRLQERAVCYEEPYVLSLYEKYGLNINQPIHYGSWCGRQDFLSYDDLIVARKGK